MQSGTITKARSKPRNLLRGIVPTYTGFNAATPTNLANATDGDMTTSTGVGTKILGGAGNVGTFIFDLGSVKTVMIGCKIGIWTSASTIDLQHPTVSNDKNTYTTNSAYPMIRTGATSETKIDTGSATILTGRYIKFGVGVNGAATGNIKLYQVMAYELGV